GPRLRGRGEHRERKPEEQAQRRASIQRAFPDEKPGRSPAWIVLRARSTDKSRLPRRSGSPRAEEQDRKGDPRKQVFARLADSQKVSTLEDEDRPRKKEHDPTQGLQRRPTHVRTKRN